MCGATLCRKWISNASQVTILLASLWPFLSSSRCPWNFTVHNLETIFLFMQSNIPSLFFFLQQCHLSDSNSACEQPQSFSHVLFTKPGITICGFFQINIYLHLITFFWVALCDYLIRWVSSATALLRLFSDVSLFQYLCKNRKFCLWMAKHSIRIYIKI